jgi:hypothetical protein
MPETIHIEGITNQEFFERHAAPGRIGLVGGSELINRMIGRAQRHQIEGKVWSNWTHAFLFQGRRADGHNWVIESDLDIRKKHIRLGVQENRISKYFNDEDYPAVAVIDLGLSETQQQALFGHALELVATGARYSLREIIGTTWALRHPAWRPKENLLAREQAFYCSAFVRHVFGRMGVELVAGIAEKNTTPHDIANLAPEHKKWLMVRRQMAGKVRSLVRRVRARLHRKET